MVITHTHAKGDGQKSVCSKDGVETNGRTDGRTDRRMEPIALFSVITRSVKMQNTKLKIQIQNNTSIIILVTQNLKGGMKL